MLLFAGKAIGLVEVLVRIGPSLISVFHIDLRCIALHLNCRSEGP
jgi:hypothetical protein